MYSNDYLFILVLTFGVIVYLTFSLRKNSSEKHKLKDENEELQKKNTSLINENKILKNEKINLQDENSRLRPFQHIADVEEETKKMTKKASEFLESAHKHGNSLIKSAQDEATFIIQQANTKAHEIADSALDAKRNFETYKKAEKSILNIIKGYGAEYIISNASLLDDLAEEYSHTQAGEELKKARSNSKLMVKNGEASMCDYVEMNRKETAEKFVLDAFSGKVDSILAKVKHDNYGKLKASIEDAYTLVNMNGSAFRNARITPEYLEARLIELRWAVTTHELKKLEQEEQRRIYEMMREEEKAKKEYEQAIKEAQKEEKMLQKAMEEAKQKMESASQEEKAIYESKLAELQAKLTIAEEKNQRAISMAQQTRIGHVYVISNIGSFGENVYKIGMTRRLEPKDRVRELGDASVPFPFDIHAMIYSEDAPALEKKLHRLFIQEQMNKINPRKEFFRVGIKDIKNSLDKMEISAHWTMIAEAKEYHESKALKQPIAYIEKMYDNDNE